jgi:hypothetical protein
MKKFMTDQLTHPKVSFVQTFVSGILGIALLFPASFFLLSLLARIVFGTKTMYYFIAPSFLQSPFDPLAWHKAQFILGCLLLAILLNGTAYRRHWLNMAIVIQGLLLLVVLVAYTFIQHIRY